MKEIVYNREGGLRLFLPLLLSVASASASVTILVLMLLSVQDCGDGSLTFRLKISYSFGCLYLTLYCSVIQIRAKSFLGIPEKAIIYSFRHACFQCLLLTFRCKTLNVFTMDCEERDNNLVNYVRSLDTGDFVIHHYYLSFTSTIHVLPLTVKRFLKRMLNCRHQN